MNRLLLAGAAALLLTVGAAKAGPFEDGYAAYQRGDYAEAVKSYRLAATQGSPGAAYNLGLMYYSGKGVKKDFVEAFMWYRMASEKGDPSAQAMLGGMYYLGLGVTQDYSRAHMWSNLASAAGNINGIRDAVAAKMTPQQIAEAQKLARECRQRNFKGCDYEESASPFSDAMQFVPLIILILAGTGFFWFVKRSRRRKAIRAATPARATNQTADAVATVEVSSETVEQVTLKPVKTESGASPGMLFAAAIFPMSFVIDMPSMMLLLRLQFPRWLFFLYVIYAFRGCAAQAFQRP